jgi:hypothetical protein
MMMNYVGNSYEQVNKLVISCLAMFIKIL